MNRHVSEQTFHDSPAMPHDAHRAFQGEGRALQPDVELLTAADVGRLVGVTPTTIRRWAKSGDCPRQMPLSGRARWSRRVIVAWLSGRR